MAGHDVATDTLPSAETQLQVADFPVFDREGKELPFSDVYNGRNATDRTLIVFVRHFFCGSCQEYLERLSATITPNLLSQSPTSTSVAVIGCGDYRLIDFYAEQTRCPFPMYSDPTRKLYDALGMINTWDVGQQPGYISKSVPRLAIEGMWQALTQLPKGLTFKNGPPQQEGGEFLFEPTGEGDKRVTWCHRMQNSWGHTEIPSISRVLLGRDAAQTASVAGAEVG